jgi:MFS family permease
VVWLTAYRFLPESAPLRSRESEPARDTSSMRWLLALSLLVMLGLGSFEVSLALQGQQVLNLQPRQIGWMFAECSLVMILVQVVALAPLTQRVGNGLLAPAFLAMAVGVALLPFATSYPALLLGVGLVAAASGLLIPALAYRVSLAAGDAQGAALGKQTAAASLGQALGSAATGWLFAVRIEAPFWVTAGLLGFGAIAALRVSSTSKELTYE